MDYQLKGLILNCTLKSCTITPIESTNMLKVTMRFYGGYKYKSLSKKGRDKLGKEKLLAKLRRDPILVPISFLEPDQTPSPVALDGPVCAAITTAFMMQTEEMVDEMKGLHHMQNCFTRKTDQAEKEWKKISNWVSDLLDQRVEVRCELERMEQDLKSKREELEQLKAEASDLRNTGLVVNSSVLGFSGGASAGPNTPNKKKNSKLKRHPGMSSEEGHEYYKSYSTHL